jgi:hypothetical protein
MPAISIFTVSNGFQLVSSSSLMIGEMYPPAGGFWELGGFKGQNLWSAGTVMAPFDQQVLITFFF